NNAQYFKDTNGIIWLRGLIKKAAPHELGTILFILPKDCWPQYRQLHIVCTSPDTSGRIDVHPNGEVQIIRGSDDWICLDNISFRAHM
ncbi:MAG: hypothetical protein ACU83U_10440, partial [Gammaproteobacteria bacterium]